jgi:predicted nucleotidyltransferase
MVQNIDSILNEIKACLVPDGVEKLVLFGSYANGTPDEDSDIDLLVVTSERLIPRNFSEKSNIYLRVAKKIDELRRQIPIDLIVHTHSMHQKFIEMDSLFSREILNSGRVFYEKNYASVA